LTDACPQPFPWGAALHFGLGRLRLAPDAFWALTTAELLALAGGLTPAEAPDRRRLEQLMHDWPDRPQPAKE
jgi:uncharacterized phage protein (TIGR02216 family)